MPARKKSGDWVLVKAIPAVISRTDETFAMFGDDDLGVTYSDSDPAVKRALQLYPDCWIQG